MELFKMTFTLGNFSSGIYLFNRSAKINLSKASLFPVIYPSEYFCFDSRWVVLNAEDRFLKISAHFQISYPENKVGDPYLFFHF